MMKPVRFCVVGLKGYSGQHLAGVRHLEEKGLGELAASMAIDLDDHPDWKAECESKGIRTFNNYQEMLDACSGKVDAVTLPTPIQLHAPMTVAALKAGYHVLVEKPLAGCVSDVDLMIAAAKETGNICAVGFQSQSTKSIREIKKRIVDGELGRVIRIRQYALWPRTHGYYGRNNWAGKQYMNDRPVFDSPMNNALGHQVMNMLYLDGPRATPDNWRESSIPQRVQAKLFRANPIDNFDSGALMIHTDTGTEILFSVTHACEEHAGPIMWVECEKGEVHWQMSGKTTVKYKDGREEHFEGPIDRPAMFENFAKAVRKVELPNCSLETARNHTVAIEMMQQSAKVQDIDPSIVHDDGQKIYVDGIEKVVKDCFEQFSLQPWEHFQRQGE